MRIHAPVAGRRSTVPPVERTAGLIAEGVPLFAVSACITPDARALAVVDSTLGPEHTEAFKDIVASSSCGMIEWCDVERFSVSCMTVKKEIVLLRGNRLFVVQRKQKDATLAVCGYSSD